MVEIHKLKTWPPLWLDVAGGQMTFQVRRNDRNYTVGDHLVLQEYDPEKGEYTGREVERKVTYIFDGGRCLPAEHRPLAPGFVVLGIAPVPFGQSLIHDQRPAHVTA